MANGLVEYTYHRVALLMEHSLEREGIACRHLLDISSAP